MRVKNVVKYAKNKTSNVVNSMWRLSICSSFNGYIIKSQNVYNHVRIEIFKGATYHFLFQNNENICYTMPWVDFLNKIDL